MPKERISVTIEKKLIKDINGYVKDKNISKSEFIEKILFNWQKEYKKQQMIEGYKAMAKENLNLANNFLPLSQKVWPNEQFS